MHSLMFAVFAILHLGSASANSGIQFPCAFSTAHPGVAATSPQFFAGCQGLQRLHQLRPAHSPAHSLFQQQFRSTSLTVQATKKQIYTIPTYDAAFKHVLSSDTVRLSFLLAFVPNLKNVTSSKLLDENMNPVEKFQLLRHFLHCKKSSSIVKSLMASSAIEKRKGVEGTDRRTTAFLLELVGWFGEIKNAFPLPSYQGEMDLVCELSNGEHVLVEMQVIPDNSFDRRALAYSAAFYANQLNKGGKWIDMANVYGLNILGGGKENEVAWTNSSSGYMRHYMFQDQLSGKLLYIDGLQIIQYSIMSAPIVNDQAKHDWLTYLKNGASMTEEEVKDQIKTPAVLEAFNRAKISTLPAEVFKAYAAEDKKFDQYSKHTARKIALAIAEVSMKAKEETKKVSRKAEEIIRARDEAARNAAEQIATANEQIATANEQIAMANEQIATAKEETMRANKEITRVKAEAAELAKKLARHMITPGTTSDPTS